MLTDRYVYSTIARAIVRGADVDWINDVYRFAPKPHAVFYLKVGIEHLTPRVLASGGFDYWESGMDFQEETDFYRSFVRYQTRLISVFDELSCQYSFNMIDAERDIHPVFKDLREGVHHVVKAMEGARP